MGATLFHLLSGRPPYEAPPGQPRRNIIGQVLYLQDPAPDVRKVRRTAPPPTPPVARCCSPPPLAVRAVLRRSGLAGGVVGRRGGVGGGGLRLPPTPSPDASLSLPERLPTRCPPRAKVARLERIAAIKARRPTAGLVSARVAHVVAKGRSRATPSSPTPPYLPADVVGSLWLTCFAVL